jgi:hypothetical protein
MKVSRRDFSKSVEEDVASIVGINVAEIQKSFSVVPLDHSVQDWSTPEIILTKEYLFLRIDDIFEIYLLSDVEISLFGDMPKFKIWQQLFEGNFQYNPEDPTTLETIKSSERLTRLGLNEKGEIIREFVLRENQIVKRNYQTWAMAQLILNCKNEFPIDMSLVEMLNGTFTRFNQKTVLTFIGVFIVYVVFKLISLLGMPDILGTIFDIIFGIVLVGMLVWSVISINKNLERYRAIYSSYYGAPTPS